VIKEVVPSMKMLLVLLSILNWGIHAPYADEPQLENHPQVTNKTIDVYWTDAAPVVDGQMNDGCWKSAAVARDFLALASNQKPAGEQTEVFACYDATHLYVFWKAHESQMDKVDPGPALDRQDEVSMREYVHVMLDPQFRRHGEHFGFWASPLGARKDAGGRKGLHFDCNWRAAGGRFDRGWTMEMSIPFTELSGDSLPYHVTPQSGDTWGINFNRVEAARGEESQWSQTGGNMNNYGCISRVFFKGRRQGAVLPHVAFIIPEPLSLGPGELIFKITNVANRVAISLSLNRDGRTVAKEQGEVCGEWKFRYSIGSGGLWQLRATLTEGGKPFFAVQGEAELPAVAETVVEIRKAVVVANEKFRTFVHPEAGRLRQAFSELQEGLKATDTWVGRTSQLTREEWRTFTRATETLRAKWNNLSYDANLMRVYQSPAAFAVGVARSDEKVYPYTAYAGSTDGVIEVAAAGNEYESVQLVVMPFWKSLENLSVSFTNLRGPQGEIPASNLSWFRVMYVRMPENHPSVTCPHPREPDILWPGEPFTVPAGTTQPLWIDVYVPTGTPAGVYEGTITVKANGKGVTRPLRVRAYGFDLPETNTLKTNFWFAWGTYSYGLGAYYGYKVPYTPALWERHVRLLARYRAQQYYLHEFGTPTPAYLEPDEHFIFDFSAFDEYIRISKEHHANCLHTALLSPEHGSVASFVNRNAVVIERQTGKRMKMEPFIADWQQRFKEGKVHWNDNPVYVDFVKGLVAYLRRMGVLDQAHCELYDEPYNSEKRWTEMARHIAYLKTIVPDLKMQNWGVNPTQVIGGKSAIGLVDIWGPHLFQCNDPAILGAVRERRAKHGEPFWFYVCGTWQGNGGWSPCHRYYHSYVQPRMYGWMAWWLGADGFLAYHLADVGDEKKNVKADPAERWPNSEWWAEWGHNLVYPGPEPSCDLIPGMRLAAIRDGLEDYEYFALLQKKAAVLDPKKDREVLVAMRAEMQIEPAIIRSVYDYTKDRRALDAKRDRLARWILRK